MKGVALAIVAALPAAGCGGSRPTLPVTVIDGYGVPLPGAKLYLPNSKEPVATTDDLGIARLSLSTGVYLLTINAKGHASVVGEYVSIKEGEAPNPMFVRLRFLAPEGYFGRCLEDHVWETLTIETADPLRAEWSWFKYNQYESWSGGEWTCEWEMDSAELGQEGNALVGGYERIPIVGPRELDESWERGKVLGDVTPPMLACPDRVDGFAATFTPDVAVWRNGDTHSRAGLIRATA